SAQGQSGDKPAEKFRENLRKVIAEGLPADAALAALTTDAARILGVDKQLGTVAAGKAAHLVVTDGDFQEAATKVRYVFAQGVRSEHDTKKDAGKKDDKKDEVKKPDEPKPAEGTEQASEIEADRKPKVHTGGNVLLRGATVLTVTNGTQAQTDVLVQGGKIA